MARLIDADSLHRKVKMETNPYGKPTIDVMEKLVELIAQKVCYTWSESCDEWMPHDCGKCYANDCHISEVADHLISNGVTVQEWISVKDRLPDNKEHDWVLAQVVEDNGFMHIPRVMEYRQLKNDWFEETYGWLSEHNGVFTVTHWMPLPKPPKGE